MKRKRHNRKIPGWLKMVVILTIATGATGGASHVVDGPAPQPITACGELQALSCRTGLIACRTR
jgi:hypothetical protein